MSLVLNTNIDSLVAQNSLSSSGSQLSTALAVRRVDESCTEFAAFDRSLRTAAAAEGFRLMPSDLPDHETA